MTKSSIARRQRKAKKRAGVWIAQPTMQRADKTEAPKVGVPLDDQYLHAIGLLITSWAQMERYMNVLLDALVQSNGTEQIIPGTLSFEHRFTRLKTEWAGLGGSPELQAFLDGALRSINNCKVLRDSIAHKEFDFGMRTDGDHLIKFYHKTRTKQKSKPFFKEDFYKSAEEIKQATTLFAWLLQSDAAWPLPEEDAEVLRGLPNMEHRLLPT